jgi:hypothetical protein
VQNLSNFFWFKVILSEYRKRAWVIVLLNWEEVSGPMWEAEDKGELVFGVVGGSVKVETENLADKELKTTAKYTNRREK